MNKELYTDFRDILSAFNIANTTYDILPYGSGHINGTFYIKNTGPLAHEYLLQRINEHVFKDIPQLIENIILVTDHLRRKLREIPGADPDREVLRLIPVKNGHYYHQYKDGSYWRMYHYLRDTNSYDQVNSPRQAYEGGKAFGRFQFLLADLDTGLLKETIRDFHNIENRLGQLNKAIDENKHGRLINCIPEIESLFDRTEKMFSIFRMGKNGSLPLRITHNDSKFNNVLLNKEDKAQCVIDLDTVMPGYVAYDFGDAIRTIINTRPEDEKDISTIALNTHLFQAYTEGYLNETIAFLTKTELASLIEGVLLLPYLQAVRFLTDYIDGDNYFKIHFAAHNLQRARAQLQLLKKIEEQRPVLAGIIESSAAKLKTSVATQ